MKKFLILILALTMLLTLTACGSPAEPPDKTVQAGFNKQIFDFTYSFDKAIISMPDGTVVKGTVESWTDYEDGDQIQVKIDGTTYLVHSTNVVLINGG